MILEGLTDRQKALIYTHILYRDTVLEDYHAVSKRMDSDFYDVIYKVGVMSKQSILSVKTMMYFNKEVFNRISTLIFERLSYRMHMIKISSSRVVKSLDHGGSEQCEKSLSRDMKRKWALDSTK